MREFGDEFMKKKKNSKFAAKRWAKWFCIHSALEKKCYKVNNLYNILITSVRSGTPFNYAICADNDTRTSNITKSPVICFSENWNTETKELDMKCLLITQ
jgi:hypothetical protein